MTTEEFAKKIGVSRVTLSKVINGKPGVSEKSKNHILESIKKYNFVPSSSARSLAGKQEKIIGLFSKESSVSRNEEGITSHYYSEFTNYLIHEAQKMGYKTLVSIASDSKGCKEIERTFNSGLISGAVLLGYENQDKKIIDITNKGYKLALVHQEVEIEADNTVLINMNDEKAAYDSIELLIKNNHKNILYIGSTHNRLASYDRLRGVKNCVENNRDKVENLYIENGDFTKESGYKITKSIFKEKSIVPTAIFASNDFMALGAINAIKEMNLSVPDDVSVMGFDDIPILKYLSPKLTTVKCDVEDMAKRTVKSLIKLIDEKKVKKLESCDLEIIERETLSSRSER